MEVFDFKDFRIFLKETLKKLPKSGHGSQKKMAEAAGVSTAFLSQVLSGKRQFSLEQASLIAEFLGLNEAESEYFLALVQFDKAGNETLRRLLKRQMDRLQKNAQTVSKRLTSVHEVKELDKPVYYSDWAYIAVQQLTAIPEFTTDYAIAERLNLPVKRIKQILTFLLRTGLCVDNGGKLGIGPARMHLAPDSLWVKQHHANWRGRALESVHSEDVGRLHYSSPMTFSKKDYEKIRSLLVAAIADIAKVVDPSPSEELACLNIDWFRIGGEGS